MSDDEGPTASYSCHGCKHYRQSRYVVQGDSGYDKWCAFGGVSRDMDEFGGTPDWCPLMPADKLRALALEAVGIAEEFGTLAAVAEHAQNDEWYRRDRAATARLAQIRAELGGGE